MIVKDRQYTLAELKAMDDPQAIAIISAMKFGKIKSRKRHREVKVFSDFTKSAKEFLLALKQEVFNNATIYVRGSRIQGTYLTDKEYETYSKQYPGIKKSDWDISSETRPAVLEFRGYKIDYTPGTYGVEV